MSDEVTNIVRKAVYDFLMYGINIDEVMEKYTVPYYISPYGIENEIDQIARAVLEGNYEISEEDE